MKITSTSNKRIKDLQELRKSQERKKKRLTIVEGRREISRAMEAGVTFKEFYFCPALIKDFDLGLMAGTQRPMVELTQSVFEKVSYGDRLEGVLGVCETPRSEISDLPDKKQLLVVVLEAVEKPGNLGAILRSADAVGADAVIVCDEQTDLYNPNIIRASLGTIFTVKVITSTNSQTLDMLKTRGVSIFTASPDATTVYTKSDFSGPTALVLGSEEKGLSPFWMNSASQVVRIPMFGKSDSLNVSVSAAVLLYEALRQRSA